MSSFKISLSENANPRYIYVSPENVVHVMIPIISADQVGIGLDNTCQSVIALKDFFGRSHDSERKRSSCLHHLQDYKAQLEHDIQLLTECGKPTDAIRSRLSQVEFYISVLGDVVNNHVGLLNGLNYVFPEYPQAFQNLIAQTDSNVYAMRLKPRTEDLMLRAHNPLFYVRRSDESPSVFYNALMNRFRQLSDFSKISSARDGFINLVKQKVYNKCNKSCPVTIGVFKRYLAGAFGECIPEINVRTSFCNDAHFSQALDNLSYSDGDEIKSDRELFELLDNLLSSFGNYEPSESSAFSTIRNEASLEQKIEKLSILTQFFLAEINIYAQSHRLLSEKYNFAQPLDSNVNFADQLARNVKEAVENGGEVEQALFKFINQNRSQFKLTRELTIQEQAQIKEKANVHFRSIKDSPHMDEFLVLDTEKQSNARFYYHQGSICCDFTKWYEQTRLNAISNAGLSKAMRETSGMPAMLPTRDNSSIGFVTFEQRDLRRLIERSISENNFDKAKMLLLKVDNEYVFQKLGPDFFKQYSANSAAKALFNRLRANITSSQVSDLFNEIVVQRKQQLLLTPDMARSLYVAVQDRRELPIERVLKYGSADEVKMILNDLAVLGRNNNPESEGYQNIIDFEVSTAANGNLLIEAPRQTVEKLQEIITRYRRSGHLAMIMSASIYKAVLDAYGSESDSYKIMQTLSNNFPGDPTPYKLIYALQLLGINIPEENIRYNNTKNTLEYKSDENANNGLPKKGGSGFIIDNIDPGQWRIIEEITEFHANRFVVSANLEQILHNQISQLQASNVLARYTSRKDKLEAALILLGIQFRRLDFDEGTNQFLLYANQEEQAKIKKIKDIFAGPDAFGIPFNNEDRQYTRNYTPGLIIPDRGQNLYELVEGIRLRQISPRFSTRRVAETGGGSIPQQFTNTTQRTSAPTSLYRGAMFQPPREERYSIPESTPRRGG
ncbi:hypothetical protein FQU71_08715 [Legionella longbeachae]|nr:hypothetical protein FQU71_08715 [Legionella longbeachae]